MKTLITRAGPGTKIVCLGNLAQIDTPYLTEGSSGLTYAVDRFKGWPHSRPRDAGARRALAPRGLRVRSAVAASARRAAAATAFFGWIRLRRPSAVRSAVSTMSSISSLGVSFGLTARILAARLATCGDAIEVPDSATRSPPGRKLSTW